MSEKTKRLDYLDELRGLAILLVVLGHLYLPFTELGQRHPVAQAIYSFHMALFFFISGYLCEMTNKIESIGYRGFLNKKLQVLIVPYLFWLFPGGMMFGNFEICSVQDIWHRFAFFPNLNIWFLPVLFIMMLLYAIMHILLRKEDNIKKRIIFLILVSLPLAVHGGIWHSYHSLIYVIYVFSFFFGSLLKSNSVLESVILNKRIMGLLGGVVLIVWYYFPLESNGRSLISMVNLVYSFVCALLAIIVLYNLFYKNDFPATVKRVLREFGQMSLVIYLLPINFLPDHYVFHGYSDTTINIFIFILGLLQCVLACIIGHIVYQFPYLRLLMFGKR